MIRVTLFISLLNWQETETSNYEELKCGHNVFYRQTRKLRDAEDYSDRALLKNMLK